MELIAVSPHVMLTRACGTGWEPARRKQHWCELSESSCRPEGGAGSVAKSKEGSAGVTRDIPAAGSGRAGPGSPALRSTLSRALVFAVRVKPVLWVMFPPKGQSSLGLRS